MGIPGMVYMRKNNANNYQFCRKAADDMEDPIAVMLKYLNVLGNISTKNNKTLVVPIPKVFPFLWNPMVFLNFELCKFLSEYLQISPNSAFFL